jgi:hypothetical protein
MRDDGWRVGMTWPAKHIEPHTRDGELVALRNAHRDDVDLALPDTASKR